MTNNREFQDAFVKYMQSQVGKMVDLEKHDAMIRSFGVKRTSRTIYTLQGCKFNFEDEDVRPASFNDDESPTISEDDFEIDQEAIDRHERMYHGSKPSTQKKRSSKKKGSLKPSRPLTDEERDALFGKPKDVTTKVKLPKTKKSTQEEGQQKKKKNSGKAPNAIRKTKKPSRL
ncbi:Oidioi.mRNA.OKI2018_I69.XSR.g16511.t1.cds [Oikopleura dioica]|uniref:Oidioi.mRNA.OKI2018_I69.XSR.g16511.t1.cds n=1 Tax=Oikopleura dioica TaxID=34765 RepID=A0ABN7SL59_OIKDI|nr:Oidioi.mRNA.OKI2018_I69.XSR.g16511.t1.cds [Oikopleura dioica]